MPKAPKSKVAKTVIHPNSRHASQLARQSHHEMKKQKSKSDTTIKQEQLRQRLQWFQDNMEPQKTSFTRHDLAVMVTDYLERFKDELEQINIVNSVGNRQSKQHVARETAIRFTLEREKAEFEGVGIEVPDLINGKNLNYFRNWTGEVRYFPNIKMRKIKMSDLNKETESKEDMAIENDSNEVLPDYVDTTESEGLEDLPDYEDSGDNVAKQSNVKSKDVEVLPDYAEDEEI